MTSTQAVKLVTEPASEAARREHYLAAWERRKKWSRTDTARHLNDRSEPLLALYRRRQPAQVVGHSRQFGYWLKEHAPAVFDRAHARLAELPDDAAREALLPTDLLP